MEMRVSAKYEWKYKQKLWKCNNMLKDTWKSAYDWQINELNSSCLQPSISQQAIYHLGCS